MPNGDPNNTGNVFDFPLRFPGQYFDRETNLAYNYFRDYDPGIGRYIQSDPVGLVGGLNSYLYALADPVRLLDPKGLQGLPGGRTLIDKLIEHLTGEAAKDISGAEGIGKNIGQAVCNSGGVPRGTLINCADCAKFPNDEAQNACFKACREEVGKCTRQKSECPLPSQG